MRLNWRIMAGGVGACVLAAAVILHAGAQAQATDASGASGSSGGAGGGQAKAARTVTVSLATAAEKDIPVLLTNIGTVQAYQSVLVRARVDGTLMSLGFTEGQTVAPGDVIAQIDPRPYQAALDAAVAKEASDEAALKNDEVNMARDQALLKNNFASRQSYDNDAAGVAQLQANIKGDDAAIAAAKLNLDFTHITAPINGRVGLRMVDPGNLIHATDTSGIVNIDQIQPISVIFSLPQDNLPQVQAAMASGTLPVIAAAQDSGKVLGRGQLLTIDNQIDPTTGTFRLKAVFPNEDAALWPGESVNASLQLDVLKGAVTVPSTAINRGPDGLFVYAVKPDRTVAIHPVQVAQDDGQTAVISSGLEAGVKVVTDGQSKLQNGSKISTHKSQASS